MSFIRINATTYNKVLDCLRDNRKIEAIKTLRNESGSGLKEAKMAVERLAHESGIRESNYPHSVKEGLKVICGPIIKKMVVNYGQGDMEIDIEGMQLRALMDMQAIGLDACRDILDLGKPPHLKSKTASDKHHGQSVEGVRIPMSQFVGPDDQRVIEHRLIRTGLFGLFQFLAKICQLLAVPRIDPTQFILRLLLLVGIVGEGVVPLIDFQPFHFRLANRLGKLQCRNSIQIVLKTIHQQVDLHFR